jgi:5'-nucleotidase
MEGTLLGIRSIALSQAYNFSEGVRNVPWGPVEALAPALLAKLIAIDLPESVYLNINFPNCPAEEVEGARVTSQGKLVHSLWLDERADGRGFPYYWLRFGREAPELKAGTDVHAVRSKLISVTPLKLDLTAHEIRDQLTKALG